MSTHRTTFTRTAPRPPKGNKGGTFVYDKDGRLIEHRKANAPAAPAATAADDKAPRGRKE